MTEKNQKLNKTTVKDRFFACLFGGAVGDALGAPVEFIKRREIIKQFGEPGIRDYVECYGRLGAITDDTQMTLFTAEGILQAQARCSRRGVGSYEGTFPVMLLDSYKNWLLTQENGTPPPFLKQEAIDEELESWLLHQPELYARRAPGNTCLSALRTPGRSIPAENDSKGCGGVMRVAPVGMFFASTPYSNERDVFLLGKNAAAITHGHPTGQFPAGVFALIVYHVLQGMPLRNAADESLRYLKELPDCDQPTADAVTAALELSQKSPNDPKILRKLGEGWVAEEALAIGLYAALSAIENEADAEAAFETGIVLAVNHDGDSDSTGSICGNLLGAVLGQSAIPQRWLEPLELRNIIEKVTADYVALWEKSHQNLYRQIPKTHEQRE